MVRQDDVLRLIEEQFQEWPVLQERYSALERIRVKEISLGAAYVKVQFNPERVLSSSARTDCASLEQRPCFLCDTNRPKEQRGLSWGRDYQILVNPYPIFPCHLTIPSITHVPQEIHSRFADMLELAALLPAFVVFYNGPECGASAPDHFHFQAGNRGILPVEQEWKGFEKEILCLPSGAWAGITFYCSRSLWLMQSADELELTRLFGLLYDLLPCGRNVSEPRMNLLVWYDQPWWTVCLFPRVKHRPSFYGTSAGELLVSPGAVDMGGLVITPLERDFERISSNDIRNMYKEVSMDSFWVERMLHELKKSIWKQNV